MDSKPVFKTIVLGARGGLYEDNLSAYLVAPVDSTSYISLDAGTILAGIRKGIEKGGFDDINMPKSSNLTFDGWILQKHVKAHLISHTHLDHVAGLVLNAPDGSKKNILGVKQTIDHLRDHLFNWKVWPNFSNEGDGFQLKKYRYIRLKPEQEYKINQTAMTVKAFKLSHCGYPSTAFLVGTGGYYLLYFGDTGPDAVEETNCIGKIWDYITPLIQEKRLCAIFLEASFPDPRADDVLFGHLTPSWMIHELKQLSGRVKSRNNKHPLDGVSVIVSHIKSSFDKKVSVIESIQRQLDELNDIGVHFIIPEQGDRIYL